ncbi:MAG: hypothetical protein QXS54_01635 [Candidatus Methanomethylicaceae archaeon]
MNCNYCNFNFEQLKMRLTIDHQRVRENRLPLYCPACGTQVDLDLQAHRIFTHEGRFYVWEPRHQISIGELILSIPGERMRTLSVEAICYRRIAVFRQLDGRISIPRWPIKKEYLHLIDIGWEASPEVIDNVYQAELSVRGYGRHFVRLPIRIYEGAHLVLWPNVRYRPWKRYFLRFKADAQNRIWIYARCREGEDWVPVEKFAADQSTRYACLDSRPEYIAIECEGDEGGIWVIEPADQEYPDVTRYLAVDFGTSNTFIAVSQAEGARPLPVRDCNLYIIRGLELPTVVDFADTWPPHRGFGRDGAIFSSEILTREILNRVRACARDIPQWKPVEDYGIPGAGVEIRYREDEHIIAGFKWREMIRDDILRQYAEDIRERYLEFLLLFALAQLAVGEGIGKTVTVYFSYPLAFSDAERESFNEALQAVAHRISEWTGIQEINGRVTCELRVDEARAAAMTGGTPSADYVAALYVDIGGGSTDIALARIKHGQQTQSYIYVTSFKYAGDGLVQALEGRFLNVNVNQFQRQVRERGIEGMRRIGNVFQHERIIERKTNYFYSYLLEFIARLLAAHIVTGEWSEGLDEVERNFVQENGYWVAFYPLGMGWGFGHFIDGLYTNGIFPEQLQSRVDEILRNHFHRDDYVPRVRITGQLLPGNPKSFVAFGLLARMDQQGQQDEQRYRSILGWTVRVGMNWTAEWFLPAVNPVGGERHRRLPAGQIDCPERDPTGLTFPRHLPSPHDLDRGLNQTRQYLNDCRGGGSGAEWFRKSPFEVLMEKLFQPKLRDLV